MENIENDLEKETQETEQNEIVEEIEVSLGSLSMSERRAFARTGVLPVITQNIYTRFEVETPKFGK